MKRTVTAAACVVAALLVPGVSGCGSSPASGGPAATPGAGRVSSPSRAVSPSPSSSAAASSGPVAAAQAIVATRSAGKLGTILVDGKGRTLYLFVADTSDKPTCTGACAAAWPPLLTTGNAKAGGGAKASLLGTAKRTGGATQVTYNKHPLYYYVTDAKPGDTNGQGLNQFGALWWVLDPAGKKVTS